MTKQQQQQKQNDCVLESLLSFSTYKKHTARRWHFFSADKLKGTSTKQKCTTLPVRVKQYTVYSLN